MTYQRDPNLRHIVLPGLRCIVAEHPSHPTDDAAVIARLDRLERHGVEGVVDLTHPSESLRDPWPFLLVLQQRRDPAVRWPHWSPSRETFPMDPAGALPSSAALAGLVAGILAALEKGRTVAVLDRTFSGRSGMVAVAVLIGSGWAPEDAIRESERLWRAASASAGPGSATRMQPILTAGQRNFVLDWAAKTQTRPRALPDTVERIHRTRSCLLGGALGDALGTAIKCDSLGDIHRRFGRYGVQEPLPAYGEEVPITDVTQMTLFTAEGLLRGSVRLQDRGLASTVHVMRRAYLRWLRTQERAEWGGEREMIEGHYAGWLVSVAGLNRRRAPGDTCLAALRATAGDPQTSVVATNTSKGCGTVMRVAPIGLFQQSVDWARERAREASAITHGHPTAIEAGGAFAAMVCALAHGAVLTDVVATAIPRSSTSETSRAVHAAVSAAERCGRSATAEDVERLGGGWTAGEALAIALFCALCHPDDYVAGVRLAANHSGNTNSTASMTGQLLGLTCGLSQMPAGWTDHLELRDVITEVSDDLVRQYWDTDDWWEKWPPN